MNSFGQTAHKPDCPVLLYAGANCTCGLGDWRDKGLERIEATLDDLRKRMDENYELTKSRAEMNYEHLRGAIDSIASELVEQRLRSMSVTKQIFENFGDEFSLIMDIRKQLKKGRKPHGKHSKIRANRKTRRRSS